MRKRLVRVVLGLVISSLLWLGLYPTSAIALSEEQKLVTEVWRIVNRAYLDETFNHQNWWFIRQRSLQQPMTTREEAYTVIQSMLDELGDPYTRLLRPEQYRSLQTNTSGELLGVGLQIAKDQDTQYLRVIAPIEGSPAEKAGIQPKDYILKIGDVSTEGLTLDEAANQMRGAIGTQVKLTLLRDSDEPFEVTIKRDRITLNPVIADLRTTTDQQAIGYIRLNQFNANAAHELMAAIDRLEHQGAVAYILDLRNNPGGLLQAGIEIARLWLDDATIVYTVNRQGVLDSFDAYGSALTEDPLIVLVNQGTASASEILAGALQDNGRAQLVGETTFGKGLIQSLFDLSDGSGLAVTVAKYETPNHHDINRLGIQPDQIVAMDPIPREQFGTSSDTQYQAAIDLVSGLVVANRAS